MGGKLKLGKGTAFVKTHIKRLPQRDDTWEADFRAMLYFVFQSPFRGRRERPAETAPQPAGGPVPV